MTSIMDSKEMSKYLFYISTVKTSSFRTLIEAIKDILSETNMEITSSGIKILSMDGTHTILVNMVLHADRFNEFYCEKNQIIGLNMINFFKLVKTMGNTDSIVLFMEKSDTTKLCVKIMNGDKQMVTNYMINICDLDIEDIPPQTDSFTNSICMPSSDFQKIVRDMNLIGDNIEMLSARHELILRCKGDFAEQETILKSGAPSTVSDKKDIAQGAFGLKSLLLFTKFTSLCSEIKIFFKNNYPLIIEYDVAGLGTIKLALAPAVIPVSKSL